MPEMMAFGISDIGLRRMNNEDAFIVDPGKGLFVVADGMGGEAAGEVASRIFADTTMEIFSNIKRQSEKEAVELVQDAFRLANERILNRAKENSQQQGMGCTAELMAFSSPSYVVGHVGDSRTYLYRQGQLRQITRDHSLIQDQIDQGLITPAEAKRHFFKNVILRAVGVNETLAVDLIRGKASPGDIFLLCSDGLTDMVDDDSIKNIISLPLTLRQRVNQLIASAKSAGGVDNITVILCEVGP